MKKILQTTIIAVVVFSFTTISALAFSPADDSIAYNSGSAWNADLGTTYFDDYDSDGTPESSWNTETGTTYYDDIDNDGAVDSSWNSEFGTTYYDDTDLDGSIDSSWNSDTGTTYYDDYDSDGVPESSWNSETGTTYYDDIDSDGQIDSAWNSETGTTYYNDYGTYSAGYYGEVDETESSEDMSSYSSEAPTDGSSGTDPSSYNEYGTEEYSVGADQEEENKEEDSSYYSSDYDSTDDEEEPEDDIGAFVDEFTEESSDNSDDVEYASGDHRDAPGDVELKSTYFEGTQTKNEILHQAAEEFVSWYNTGEYDEGNIDAAEEILGNSGNRAALVWKLEEEGYFDEESTDLLTDKLMEVGADNNASAMNDYAPSQNE